MSLWDTLKRAGRAAFRGGIPGLVAMVLQVVLLMWMRTTINYQMKTGCSISEAFSELYEQGGIPRFYSGMSLALIAGPIARFGDTAALEGVKEFFKGSSVSVATQTLIGSIAAGCWRVFSNPIAMMKTALQTDGSLSHFWHRIETNGLMTIYSGAAGAWVATTVGNYPWQFVFNHLESAIPKQTGGMKHVRNGFIGCMSSIVSDICSNAIRRINVMVQVSDPPIGYTEAFNDILSKGGIGGFFVGLEVKILSNALQAIFFAIAWKYMMETWFSNKDKNEKKNQDASKIA